MARPNSPVQELFLRFGGYEAALEGGGGGGKSIALLLDALYDVDDPFYRAILFRRYQRDVERTFADKSVRWYPALGGIYNVQASTWHFPSGARIMFSHLERAADVERHRSVEYQYLGFDELTTFEAGQYTFLKSRLRSDSGLRCRVRVATNPDAESWVKQLLGPWVDRRFPMRAASGEVLHVRRTADGLREEFFRHVVPRTQPRACFRLMLKDNPAVTNAVEYETALGNLDPVTRKRMRDGDWDARAAAGTLFKSAWFDVIEEAAWEAMRHRAVARVRSWDLAATAEGDYTVGVLLAYYPNRARPFVVEDVVRLRGRPKDAENAVRRCAEADGREVPITIPQESGQSGKFQVTEYVRRLAGWRVRPRRVNIPGAKKVVRAGPASSQAEQHQFSLVRGAWNDPFLLEIEEFPDGKNDDQVDAFADAFEELSGQRAMSAGQEEVFRALTASAGGRYRQEQRLLDGDLDDETGFGGGGGRRE